MLRAVNLLTKNLLTWLAATVVLLACVTLTACAHRPQAASDVESARSELSRLEGSISARRDRLPNVAEGATSPESVPSRSTSATQSAPAPRCDGVCQGAQEICGFSRRICQLAEQIADEPSQRSCKRADRECGTASGLCASCR